MAHRMFTDRDGRSWEVWEVIPAFPERRAAKTKSVPRERRSRSETRLNLPIELQHGWLAFQSKHERRMLAPPAEGWVTMTDAQLGELLAHAVSKGNPRRLIE